MQGWGRSCWGAGAGSVLQQAGTPASCPAAALRKSQPAVNRCHRDERLLSSDLSATKLLQCDTVFYVNTYFIFQNGKRHKYIVPCIPDAGIILATPDAAQHTAAGCPPARLSQQESGAAFHLQMIELDSRFSSPFNFSSDKAPSPPHAPSVSPSSTYPWEKKKPKKEMWSVMVFFSFFWAALIVQGLSMFTGAE